MKKIPPAQLSDRLRDLEAKLRAPAAPPGEHLTEDQLVAYAEGSVAGPDVDPRAEAHLGDCVQCADLLEGLMALGDVWDEAVAAAHEVPDVELWAFLSGELEKRRAAAVEARRAEDAELEARVAALRGYAFVDVPEGPRGTAPLARLAGTIARGGFAPTMDGGEIEARLFRARGAERQLLGGRRDVVRCTLIRAGLSAEGALEVRLALPDPVPGPAGEAGAPRRPVRVSAVEVDIVDRAEKTLFRVTSRELKQARYLDRPVQLVDVTRPGAGPAGRPVVVDPSAVTVRLLVDEER
jgi:hypothetical protein